MGTSHVSPSHLNKEPEPLSEPTVLDNSLPIKISIKTPTGKTLELEMEPNDSVKSLRTKIEDLEGPTCSQHRIIFESRQLADNLTLSECKIQTGSIVHLVQRKRDTLIFVKGYPGETYSLDVDFYDLVSEVKENLKEKMEEKRGTIVDNPRLMYPGRILDDTKSLSYYNISEGVTLHIVLCKFR